MHVSNSHGDPCAGLEDGILYTYHILEGIFKCFHMRGKGETHILSPLLSVCQKHCLLPFDTAVFKYYVGYFGHAG